VVAAAAAARLPAVRVCRRLVPRCRPLRLAASVVAAAVAAAVVVVATYAGWTHHHPATVAVSVVAAGAVAAVWVPRWATAAGLVPR